MELDILNSVMESRTAFDKISKYLDPTKYTADFKILYKFVSEYYQRDSTCTRVDRAVLAEYVATKVSSEKQAKNLVQVIDLAYAKESISTINVEHLVVLAKKHEVSKQLAEALVSESPKAKELIKEYEELDRITTIEELNDEGTEVLHEFDVATLVNDFYDPSQLLRLYPSDLNSRLDGGLRPGHHVVCFGRPEMGKSAFGLNAACGFARQGHRGLYLFNEDSTRSTALRVVSNLSGLNRRDILEDPAKASSLAYQKGFSNLYVISMSPGTPDQIERWVEKYEPKWIVVDQLRNIKVSSRDGNTVQLELAAKSIRNIIKKYGLVGVSLTQAGDSAEGKLVLNQSDIDSSKTGIPGQADVLIGIGADDNYKGLNERQLSICKNKVGEDHDAFAVKIVPSLSRYTCIDGRP